MSVYKYSCQNHEDRKARSSKTLLCSYCYKKKLLETNPSFKEQEKESIKKFHIKNPLYKSEYYWKHKEQFPEKHTKTKQKQVHSNLIRKLSRYNLSLEEYDKLLQNGCQVCGSKERPHLDHDHKTGKFRGLLCGKCNTGLGMFDDSIDKLNKIINYLTSAK